MSEPISETVESRKGRNFTIILPLRVPYVWEESLGDGVVKVDKKNVPNLRSFGGKGKTHITLNAKKVGNHEISFQAVRPSDKAKGECRRYLICVVP